MKEIIKKWDKILGDLSWEEFDVELFQTTLKESFDIMYNQFKEGKMDIDTALLLIKMARFSERELFCNEQDAARYLVAEILYQVENGFNDKEIDAGELKFYAPNSADMISIDVSSFDIAGLIEHCNDF
jgi:hypothetical protein